MYISFRQLGSFDYFYLPSSHRAGFQDFSFGYPILLMEGRTTDIRTFIKLINLFLFFFCFFSEIFIEQNN